MADKMKNKFGWKTVRVTSVVVFVVYMSELLLLSHVNPISSTNRPDYAITAIGLLAAVLALLAGGCMAAYFSFYVLFAQGRRPKSP